MDIMDDLLKSILEDPYWGPNIIFHGLEPVRNSQWLPFPDDLAGSLRNYLRSAGINNLYTHQRQAYDMIRSGRNIIVSSGVASGKSLCYQLPVLQTLQEDADLRAMLIFPTKALAQDQRGALEAIISHAAYSGSPAVIGIYDGDTSLPQRKDIRDRANFVITNPDMLHMGILPHHTGWHRFFRNLRFVVIDEVHVYRGIFGSHFANVLQRLKRLTLFYGVKPVFIFTSATLTNVSVFVHRLIHEDAFLISDDGSPGGERHFLIYNPPYINRELGLRKNYMTETVKLAKHLLKFDLQTLIFAHTRRMVELILTYLQAETGESHVIKSYRGGYLPSSRRKLEKDMKSGITRITVATNALELGIDIGGLDVVLINGYPGSIASLRQQAGRGGRGVRKSLTILVLSPALIDQYLIRHPEFITDKDPEAALINPENPFILLFQLKCALFEKPFLNNEGFGCLSPEELVPFLDLLQKYGVLHDEGEKKYWISDAYPAGQFSLRTLGADYFLLQHEGKTLGLVDASSAFWMTHPQAIYIHEGDTYLVKDLHLQEHIAELSRIRTDYYTQAISQTDFELLLQKHSEEVQEVKKFFGQLKVTHRVTGFKKIKWFSNEILGYCELDLPPQEMITYGYWFALGKKLVDALCVENNWNNRSNDYGPGWSGLTSQIQERDGRQCRICGYKGKERVLDVHHRKPFRTFADPQKANHPDNLITLCRTCHRRIEKNFYIQSGLSGLAFLLGNISPFYLMCDRKDIHVVVQENSKLAEGLPVIVIYDSIPGGMGLAEKLYSQHSLLLQEALAVVRNCACTTGCPSCVGPEAEMGQGSKRIVKKILETINHE